jgi:hypothetical protein
MDYVKYILLFNGDIRVTIKLKEKGDLATVHWPRHRYDLTGERSFMHEANQRRRFVEALVNKDSQTVAQVLSDRAEAKGWVEHNCQLGACMHYGLTPLHISTWVGDDVSAKLLLAAGADAHARNAEGATVLHYAATRERVEIARMLLEAGVNVNVPHHNSETPPILSAAYGKNVEIIQLLLDYGANPHQSDRNGLTALALAKRMGNNAPLVALLEQAEHEGLDGAYRKGLNTGAKVMKPLNLKPQA